MKKNSTKKKVNTGASILRRMLKRKKPATAVTPVAPKPDNGKVVTELPPLEDAIARIERCGYVVRRCGTEQYRVNRPDPVGDYSERSYFDTTRLREIGMLKEAGITAAVSTAPMRATPVYLGTWTSTLNGDYETAMSNENKKPGLPESSLTDEQVVAFIKKAAGAGVKLTPSAICRYIRNNNEGLSEKRCARILKTVDKGSLPKPPAEADAPAEPSKTATKATAKPKATKAAAGKSAKAEGTKKSAKKPLLKPKEKKAAAAAK